MKAIYSLIAALGLAFVLTAPASAAQSDPEVIIYRFPGVHDDGGVANTGVATVFLCTNFSGATENIRFVTRDGAGAIHTNVMFSFQHLATGAASTHLTVAYAGASLTTGAILFGTTAIAATSTNIICTAMTIDASAATPTGLALRGIRFSPIPGSQE